MEHLEDMMCPARQKHRSGGALLGIITRIFLAKFSNSISLQLIGGYNGTTVDEFTESGINASTFWSRRLSKTMLLILVQVIIHVLIDISPISDAETCKIPKHWVEEQGYLQEEI